METINWFEPSVIGGLLVLAFLAGRAVQRQLDGSAEVESWTYRLGYENGFYDGQTQQRERTFPMPIPSSQKEPSRE